MDQLTRDLPKAVGVVRVECVWCDSAGVRALLGAEPPDRELVELIGELSIASKRFATLWARYDVKHRTSGPTAFYHPQVGQLDLHYTILHLPEQRQMIVTYHADPGSPSEESLRLLASLTS